MVLQFKQNGVARIGCYAFKIQPVQDEMLWVLEVQRAVSRTLRIEEASLRDTGFVSKRIQCEDDVH